MINEMKIENFKCYKNVAMKFRMFNVLTGTNSSGKSSIIQGALLHNESVRAQDTLNLKNVFEHDFIGYKEITNEKSNQEFIQIDIDGTKVRLNEFFFNSLPINNVACVEVFDRASSQPYIYLSSSRNISKNQIEGHFYGNGRGYVPKVNNEHIGHFLYQFQTDLSKESIEKMSLLMSNLKKLGFMSDLLIVRKGEGNYRIFIDNTNIENVGVGVQYVLPLLVSTIFNSEKTIFIENPEIHLHPGAQTTLMTVLIELARSFKNQIIIETHSDHIVNALRVMINDKTLISSDLNVVYIDRNHGINSIYINESGRYGELYDGFFDEIEKQLIKLL